MKFGVNLVFVDPRYTSQTCHKCLHIHPIKGESYRSGKRFKCGHCSWVGDADENGAKNISSLGLYINQPGGSYLSCVLWTGELVQLTICDTGLLKTQASTK